MRPPKWLKAVFRCIEGQEHAEEKKLAWQDAASIAMANGRGFVARSYNVSTDQFDWHFGSGCWPKLTHPITREHYDDDPFLRRVDDIPLEEFVRYLNDWYFPRKHKAEAI